MKQLRQYLSGNMRQYGMVIALTVITLLFGILTDGNIFNAMNVSNLILQNSYLILLSVGMFFCILTGNVDLSVGSVLAFCGSILGVLIVKCGLNPWLSTILVLALGVTIGVIQGVFIAYLNVPPFIVTLAGELMFRGLTLVILAGHSISPFPADFQYIASGFVAEQLKAGPVNILAVICAVCAFAAIIWIQIADRRQRIGYGFAAEPIAFTIIKNVLIFIVAGFIFYKMATYRGIPLILLILLAFVLIYNFIATKTIIGRQVYALGGNRAAAALSGINTKRLMLIVYANSSFMAAVSSIIVTARLNAASTSAGTNFELDAIAACYIGGCAAGGGEGTIMGVLIGALTGYFGGWGDEVLMRLCDSITAFPSILLALVVIAVLGPGKWNVIWVLGILFIPSFARMARGTYASLREVNYVKSARLMGASSGRLPNTWSVLLPALTIGFNNAVLAEASMSYLCIGVTPPDASLGYMLSESQGMFVSAPWYALGTGLTLVWMIFGVGLIGEGLQRRNGGDV